MAASSDLLRTEIHQKGSATMGLLDELAGKETDRAAPCAG